MDCLTLSILAVIIAFPTLHGKVTKPIIMLLTLSGTDFVQCPLTFIYNLCKRDTPFFKLS